MKISLLVAFVVAALAATALGQPRVFILDGKALAERKANYVKKPDASTTSAVRKLERDAAKAMIAVIEPVTSKEVAPPSGDKHDYMSQAPYFWPNPATPNGLPYIRKDGERNPEIKRVPDHDRLDAVVLNVGKLARAYYFTEKEEYAKRASEILRLWFIDPKTKMNPNLEFAQAIPGLNTGRGIGIIETAQMSELVDSVGLLGGSKSWTKVDQKSLEDWFAKYLTWLTTSKNGREEAAAKNNHGVHYDVQIVSFALFTGNAELAKKQLDEVSKKRILSQIEADGRMPLELERTKSWSYTLFNLEAFTRLAAMGEKAGVDLWNFKGGDGRGIRAALGFAASFADRHKDWKYKQIEEFDNDRLYRLLRRASGQYTDAEFKKYLNAIPAAAQDSLF